jgi:hypothetical protein
VTEQQDQPRYPPHPPPLPRARSKSRV